MQNHAKNVMYESSSEKELIKMWEDIKGGNTEELSQGLMKAIAKNEEEELWKVGGDDPLYAKRMWDSQIGKWVEFSIWGAYYIVNERKEYVVLQIWRRCDIQPKYGPTLKGWHSIDSSYLNDQLREKDESQEKFEKMQSGIQAFKAMVKQDHKEVYEGCNKEAKECLDYHTTELGFKSWIEMVRHDQAELYDEGRYEEMNGYQRGRRV